jgi:hypothetical protein
MTAHPIPSEGKYLLVTIANEAYFDHARQVFGGAATRGYWKWDMMMLSDCINSEMKLELETHGIIAKELPLPFNHDECREMGMTEIHPINMMKHLLFLPDFQKWDKIIYMDADIIVNGPIHGMLAVKRFAAIPDWLYTLENQFMDPAVASKICTNRDPRASTFNAGVFAFCPAALPENTSSSLNQLAKQHLSKTTFADQSIMNIFFYEWEPLSAAYNYFPGFLNTFPFPSSLALVAHFAGQDMPRLGSGSYWAKRWEINRRAYDDLPIDPGKPVAFQEVIRAFVIRHNLTGLRRWIRYHFPKCYHMARILTGRAPGQLKN